MQALTHNLAGQREAPQQELRQELVRSHQELASVVARTTVQAAAVPVSGTAAADADSSGVRGSYLKHIDVTRAMKQQCLRFRCRI